MLTMWLKPVTASKSVIHTLPAASATTPAALLTKYTDLSVLAFTRL